MVCATDVSSTYARDAICADAAATICSNMATVLPLGEAVADIWMHTWPESRPGHWLQTEGQSHMWIDLELQQSLEGPESRKREGALPKLTMRAQPPVSMVLGPTQWTQPLKKGHLLTYMPDSSSSCRVTASVSRLVVFVGVPDVLHASPDSSSSHEVTASVYRHADLRPDFEVTAAGSWDPPINNAVRAEFQSFPAKLPHSVSHLPGTWSRNSLYGDMIPLLKSGQAWSNVLSRSVTPICRLHASIFPPFSGEGPSIKTLNDQLVSPYIPFKNCESMGASQLM